MPTHDSNPSDTPANELRDLLTQVASHEDWCGLPERETDSDYGRRLYGALAQAMPRGDPRQIVELWAEIQLRQGAKVGLPELEACDLQLANELASDWMAVFEPLRQEHYAKYCPVRARYGDFPCVVGDYRVMGERARYQSIVIYDVAPVRASVKRRALQLELDLQRLWQDSESKDAAWKTFATQHQLLGEVEPKHVHRSRDCGLIGNHSFVVTESTVQATNLSDLAGLPPKYDAQQCVEWTIQILSGLVACHTFSVYHRDLNMHSVFLHDNTAKLHFVGRTSFDRQLEDKHPVQTDSCGVGRILYELLSGRRPNEATLVGPSTMWGRGDAELDLIVLRAIDPIPAKGFPTASAFRNSLRDWLSSKT